MMKWMSWFRTLSGQFVIVVASAVILSNFLVFVLFETSREGEIRGLRGDALVAGVGSTFNLIESVSPTQRDQVIRLASSPFRLYWLSDTSPLIDHQMTEEEFRMAHSLSQIQENSHLGRIEIQIFADGRKAPLPARQPSSRIPEDRNTNTVWLFAQATSSGQWIVARLSDPSSGGPARFPDLVLAAIAAMILTCAAAAWIAGRVSRPLSELAAAAGDVARGGSTPRLNARGPSDVSAAAEAFNAMSDRVTRTLESHRQLLSAVGHDLRTPLAAMRITAEFVGEGDIRERLTRNLDELQSLTETVLAAARSQPGEKMRRVDLAALTETVCEDLAEMDMPVDCDISGTAPCMCRTHEIRRALRNLIENAVRYGGGAQVSLRSDPNFYQIWIEDNGPGIPEARMEEVFEPFVRLEESRSNETGGSGLGLTLARTIAREHGGDVILQNREEGGLSAILTLPRERATQGNA
jgi:signal transduction histidine kinase